MSFDVTQFGADPTGAADSTAAIQAALDAAGSGQAVLVPPGNYRITATLTLPGRQALRLFSPASCNESPMGAFLRWHGDAKSPALLLSGCRDCVLERIGINADMPLRSAVRLETLFGFTSTHNGFKRVVLAGGNRMTTGFETLAGTGGDDNNDVHSWEDCSVVQIGPNGQCWCIGHGQSVCNTMTRCSAAGGGPAGGAVAVRQSAGHFNWQGGTVVNLGVAFYLGNASYPVAIRDVGVEGVARLLDTTPNAGVAQQVLLQGVRCTADSLAADRGLIRYGFAGTLTCDCCTLGEGGANQPQIQSTLNYNAMPAVTSRVVVRGTKWGATGSMSCTPFVQMGGSKCRATFSDNRYTDAAGRGVDNPNWD